MVMLHLWTQLTLLLLAGLCCFCQNVRLFPSDPVVDILEGDHFIIACNSTGEDLSWFNQNKERIISNQKDNVHTEFVNNELLLVFQNITERNNGTYTCAAIVHGRDENVQFTLNFIKPIKFSGNVPIVYAEDGSNVSLPCEVLGDSSIVINWDHNGYPVEGKRYTYLADGLLIKNVTSEDYGEYVCKAVLITKRISDLQRYVISLRRIQKPEIISDTYTIYGILNTTVDVECKVIADPTAHIIWYRNGINVLNDHNAKISQTNNVSILHIPILDTAYFGEYMCNATNSYGSDSKNFKVEEAPFVPGPKEVIIRLVSSNFIQLDILPGDENFTYSYYEVQFAKYILSDNTTDDVTYSNYTILQIKPSETEPYCINNLEPNTSYLFRVGSCTKFKFCSYTAPYKITTKVSTTSASSVIISSKTLNLFLLTKVILSYMYFKM